MGDADTFPSTLAESYAYDAVGNLTSETDRKNQTIQYVYDALDRLSSKNYPDSTSANQKSMPSASGGGLRQSRCERTIGLLGLSEISRLQILPQLLEQLAEFAAAAVAAAPAAVVVMKMRSGGLALRALRRSVILLSCRSAVGLRPLRELAQQLRDGAAARRSQECVLRRCTR